MKLQRPVCPAHSIRGFNLIEAAIVLGVIGLVIGGIWVAASAITDNRKWEQTQKGLMYYADMIPSHFNARIMAGTTTIDPYSFLTTLPMPDGWGIGGNYGIHPIDSCGHSLTFQVQAQFNRFYIGFSGNYPQPDGMRKDVCIKLERFFLSNLYPVYTRVAGGPSLSCATDISQCCPDPSNGVGAYFRLPMQ